MLLLLAGWESFGDSLYTIKGHYYLGNYMNVYIVLNISPCSFYGLFLCWWNHEGTSNQSWTSPCHYVIFNKRVRSLSIYFNCVVTCEHQAGSWPFQRWSERLLQSLTERSRSCHGGETACSSPCSPLMPWMEGWRGRVCIIVGWRSWYRGRRRGETT